MMRLAVVLSLWSWCVSCTWAQAQTTFFLEDIQLIDSTWVEKYTFANWETNRIDFYGEDGAVQRFFERLDSLYYGCDGHLNVFHIGGSHIQADIYSNKTRAFLQRLKPCMKASRGLVFPYRMAGTNNPYNYRVDYTGEWTGERCVSRTLDTPLGLTGMSARTQDSQAGIEIYYPRHPDNVTYLHDRVKVYHNTGQSGYHITLQDSSNLMTQYTNRSLGYTLIYLKQARERIALKLYKVPEDTSTFVLHGIELQNDNSGITYHSIGVNGASFTSYLKCALFEEQLKQIKPDLFIISVGTNDSYGYNFDPDYYEANYEKFLSILRRVNPDVAVILTVPNDCYLYRKRPNKNVRLVRDVIVKLAKKYNYAVWDFYGIMGGLGSSQRWYKQKLMRRDRIHFTSQGYHIKAQMFGEAFINAWMRATGVYIDTDGASSTEENHTEEK